MILYGFPAHAGIDPAIEPYSGRGPRFPRPRGDRPLIYQFVRKSMPVSPPTRG